MRKSVWLARRMKKAFKDRTNRDLRIERKRMLHKIVKDGLDPDDASFTPAYRMGSTWCYD